MLKVTFHNFFTKKLLNLSPPLTVEHKANAYRVIVAVLSLAKKYGDVELELALMYAAQKRILKVKSITSILDKKLYLQKSANNTVYETPSLFNTHQNLRGPNAYK